MLGWIVGGVVLAALVAAFWEEVKDFFEETLRAAKREIDEFIHASRVFVKNAGDKIKLIVRHYYIKDGEEYEYKSKKKIPKEDVPPEIREKAEKYEKYEITSELEMYS